MVVFGGGPDFLMKVFYENILVDMNIRYHVAGKDLCDLFYKLRRFWDFLSLTPMILIKYPN